MDDEQIETKHLAKYGYRLFEFVFTAIHFFFKTHTHTYIECVYKLSSQISLRKIQNLTHPRHLLHPVLCVSRTTLKNLSFFDFVLSKHINLCCVSHLRNMRRLAALTCRKNAVKFLECIWAL